MVGNRAQVRDGIKAQENGGTGGCPQTSASTKEGWQRPALGPGIPLLVGSRGFLEETKEEAHLLAGLGNSKRQMVWSGQLCLGVTRLWPGLAPKERKEAGVPPEWFSARGWSESPTLAGHWPFPAATCTTGCCMGVP